MESIEYRPNAKAVWALAGVLGVAAFVLAWVGAILRPADSAAMSGLTRILFTAVSIRWFSWVMTAVFLWLAWRVARRNLRAAPTIVIADAGLTIPTGAIVPWDRVASVEMERNGLLAIELEDMNSQRVILSSLDLGTDPEAVAREIKLRRHS